MDWRARLRGLVRYEEGELEGLLLAFAYFFCLLSSYYILQPLRDQLGLEVGTRHLPWLFMASMGVMALANPVFSWLVSRWPRGVLIPRLYRFFLLNILGFWLALETFTGAERLVVAKVFFLWVSVFNLFAVSVFWSFMADLHSGEQGKRLFGFIGAGGTAGQLLGSLVTAGLARSLGAVRLLLISAFLLELAVRCVVRLNFLGAASEGVGGAHAQGGAAPEGMAAKAAGGSKAGSDAGGEERAAGDSPPEGGALDGARLVLASPYLLGICAFIFLYTFTSSFLYFAKAAIVSQAFTDSNARGAFFGTVNLVVGVSTLLVQVFLTGRLLSRLGVTVGLVLTPLVTAAGFLVLGLAPGLAVYVGFEVLRKATNYAVARPAREVLYTVVTREEKYKSKNLIDTFVYRGGDGLAAAAFKALQGAGLGLVGMAYTAVPFALLWAGVGVWLGRRRDLMAREDEAVPRGGAAAGRGGP